MLACAAGTEVHERAVLALLNRLETGTDGFTMF